MQNFGRLKTTFNNLLVEDISNKTSEHKNIYKEFLKTLKESNILKTQFNVYYNIENKNEIDEFKASEFIKENINLLNNFSKKEIVNENKKLKSILSKYKINLVESDYNRSDLHDDITTLIFRNKNVDSIVESLSNIVKYNKTNLINKSSLNESIPPNSFIGNLMVEKFNEKYSNLNDYEKKILKTIFESNLEKKKEILVNLKNECTELVNKKLIGNDNLLEKETLLNVKESLLGIEYVEETFKTNISKLIELKKAFHD
jgi:hypothetical protein